MFVIPPITLVRETLSALVVGRVLTRASVISWDCGEPVLTLDLLVDGQVISCVGVFRCKSLLWFVKAFHFGMSGEINSGTLPISWTRSKDCDSQSKSLSSCSF